MRVSISTLLAVVGAALLGGVFGSLFTAEVLMKAEPVRAQDEKAEPLTLAASSFQLVDGKGRKRGEFAIGKDGEPSLQLFDGSGFACLTIGVLDDRAGIAIAGPERENKRATTLLGVNGTTPQISLTSGSGGATIFVSVEEGKSPRVQLIKTGHKGEAQYSTYATLNVVEEGSLLMLAPVHQVTPGGVEDPAENTLLAGRIDFDVQKYGIKVFGKDNSSHSEWPPKK